MSTLADIDLLDLWEDGCAKPGPLRAQALLDRLYAGERVDRLVGLSIGERDRLLLAARSAIFGRRLACFTHCPQCDEPLEFDVDAAALDVGLGASDEPSHELRVQGLMLRFRLIDTGDLVAASGARDPAQARAVLLDRILLDVQRDDGMTVPARARALSAEVQSALAERLASLDPQADLTVSLRCEACTHTWSGFVDIAAFLWAELSALARRLLLEVHTLARAYGWSERDVLELTRARRDTYLRLVTA
jgi:hypothetical protein